MFKMTTVSSKTEQYDFVSVRGCGSFGRVSQYRRRRDSKTVVIKKILSRKRAWMKQEIKIVAALARENLEDCNIVRFFEAFEDSTHYYLVFEELEKTLYQLQMEHEFRKLAVRDIRTVIFQILTALVKLKDMGIVHTDLKTENVMVVNQQRQPFGVKLIDFGGSLTTNELSSMWKPYIQPRCYRAPEVLLGLPCCEKIDIWSLGCMVAELDIGCILFPGNSELEVAHRIFECRGMPSAFLINSSSKARMFFYVVEDPNGVYKWKLRERLPCRMKKNLKRYKLTSLDQLATVENPEPGFQREDAAEIADRLVMVDLLKRMLTLNPYKRISASQALRHPFFTLQHLRVSDSYRQYYEYCVQGYKEALVPYQDSMDEEQVPSRETSDHTQEEKCSLRMLLWSLFTSVCLRRSLSDPMEGSHTQPLLQDNNVSLEATGKAVNLEYLADNTADTNHVPCEEMEKERSHSAIDKSQKTLQQCYQEAMVPQHPSREEYAGCAFQPPGKSSSMEHQGSLVMSDSSPVDIVSEHNQELPKKKKGSLRKSLRSLFTCFHVRRHKKRLVTSQNNDRTQNDSSQNAETYEDLADTNHTACDKVAKEMRPKSKTMSGISMKHQLSAIDNRQTTLQQGYQEAVISQKPSREEDAGCTFQSPRKSSSMEPQASSVPNEINSCKSDLDCTENFVTCNQFFSREEDTGCAFQHLNRSSSMEPQVSSIPSLNSSLDSVSDPTQELPKKKTGSMRKWWKTFFTCFGVRRNKKQPVAAQDSDESL